LLGSFPWFLPPRPLQVNDGDDAPIRHRRREARRYGRVMTRTKCATIS
jgi:hypothetical protein